ncbi:MULTISPECIES: patatin-like protein [unclassified Actinopolyspora]|uniref:patatin-like protein n=1 Tax=Actinopolyspora sp. BKK1 TaxID=2599394 RepID=UPI0013F66CE6|nr:patatin-like protein [Actinopolyspora sp. BKK2]NHE77824.1 patatin-like protein [Actinopolyspora sp. BKK1]
MSSQVSNSGSCRQLRLALALRGGASMAVWIGGAVAETDRLRRWVSHGQERGSGPRSRHPWAALAELAGYDSVELDVLAGTSAGGLNATLLATSLVYGMPFGVMRRAWIRLADLEAMARPVPRPWEPRPDSLLEGDGYFRSELGELLSEGIGNGSDVEAVRRVELLLTATLLDPVSERHFDAAGTEFDKARRRAMFRFRHRGRPGEPLSDFGSAEQPADTARLLAQAARTTSSFPFAFEPAVFRSAPRDGAERGNGAPAASDSTVDGTSGVPNMHGRFSEASGSDGARFRAMDGGVLDNIPVTAAVEAIRQVEADTPTERWLLYLNPEPDPQEPSERTAGLARAVTATALRAKLGQESLLTDIEAIEEHNRRAREAAGRREAVFAELVDTPRPERWGWLSARVSAVRVEHAERFAEARAESVHELLTAPKDTAGTPLLAPLPKQPLLDWPATACTGLRERLVEHHRGEASRRPAEVFDDTDTLLAAVDECLRWTRELEAHCALPTERFGVLKGSLYRLRAVFETLEGHVARCWVHAARSEPVLVRTELDGWIECVWQRQYRLQHALPSPMGALLDPLLGSVSAEEPGFGTVFQRRLADFAAELSSVVESAGVEAADSDTGVDPVAEGWAVLDRLAGEVLEATSEEGTADLDRVTRAFLETASDGDAARLLRTLVVIGAPLGVGDGDESRVLLHRLAGDRSSPLPFTALRDENGRIPVPDKVRGSGMGNFAAFLSAKWRANDWMWGRLDAVASLVEMLVEPGRLRRHVSDASRAGDELQAILCEPTTAELGELDEPTTRKWREFLAERWAERSGAVRAELEALFASPADEHPLTATRAAVTERLQWTVVAEELPFVEAVDSGADPTAGDVPIRRDPRALDSAVRNYDVGKQRCADLAEDRVASMATRFTLLAHRALLPRWRGFRGVLAALAVTVAKPVLLLIAFGLAAPRRTAICVMTGAAATVLAGTAERDGTWAWLRLYELSDAGVGMVGGAAAALAVLAAARWGWLSVPRSGSSATRWLGGLVAGGLFAAVGYWALGAGPRLGPLGVLVVAVWIVWYASFALRKGGRTAATVLALVSFGTTLGVAVAFDWSVPGWMVLAAVTAAWAQTLLLSIADVLRPRPRPRGGHVGGGRTARTRSSDTTEVGAGSA